MQITTDNLEEDISELQRRVINTERIVRKKSRELNTLLNYKDKEYPLKCMKSEQLREQCELVMEDNAVELEEVEQQITDELDKHRQMMEGVKRNLTTKAAQVSLCSLKAYFRGLIFAMGLSVTKIKPNENFPLYSKL